MRKKQLMIPFPILSCPILSYPILSYPILSCPVLSYPTVDWREISILSERLLLSYPILSCPILSHPLIPYPILSYLFEPILGSRFTSQLASPSAGFWLCCWSLLAIAGQLAGFAGGRCGSRP